MKLEVAPREDAQFRVLKIQSQLEAMHLEIQNLCRDQGKEVGIDFWCIRCKGAGHTKGKCPLLSDYLQEG